MANILVVVILIGIIAAAIGYIIREKRRGVKCIGCPAAMAGTCSKSNNKTSECSCNGHSE